MNETLPQGPRFIDEMGFDGFSLALIFLLAAGLGLVLAAVRGAVALIPMSQSQREMTARVLPVVELGVMVIYAAIAIPALFGQGPLAQAAAAVVLLTALIASWGPLRDVVSGVVIKASGNLHIGDGIMIDDVKGQIRRIGLRVLELETGDGNSALVPFSHIAQHTLLRSPAVSGSYRYRFSVPAPDEELIGEAKHLIREVALLSHWSQVARDPEIHFADGASLEIQVFPVDPNRGPDIEASVRHALVRAKLIPNPAATAS